MHNPFSTYLDTHIMHNPGLCKMCATDLMNVVLVAAASHVENGNEITQHTDALKILILQHILEKYWLVKQFVK